MIDANYVTDKQEKIGIKDLIKQYNMMPPISVSPDIPTTASSSVEESGSLLESIIGENTLRPIAFLLRAIEVSRIVCYVGVPGGSGTGFLIGQNLLITNNHVIGGKDILEDCIFRFNYQIRVDGRPENRTEYKAQDSGLFHTSPAENLDYTVVQLEETSGTIPLSSWGYANLSITAPTPKSRVNIIQHPGGMAKQVSIQNNFLEYVDEKIVQYLTATLPGSSGAPVFDDNWRVVALHRSGGMVEDPLSRRNYFRNAGIRISAVLRDLPENIRSKLPNLT